MLCCTGCSITRGLCASERIRCLLNPNHAPRGFVLQHRMSVSADRRAVSAHRRSVSAGRGAVPAERRSASAGRTTLASRTQERVGTSRGCVCPFDERATGLAGRVRRTRERAGRIGWHGHPAGVAPQPTAWCNPTDTRGVRPDAARSRGRHAPHDAPQRSTPHPPPRPAQPRRPRTSSGRVAARRTTGSRSPS